MSRITHIAASLGAAPWLATRAHAQQGAVDPLSELPSVGLSLAAVLAVIVIGAWLLRRSQLLAGARRRGGMQVVASLALGPRERIVIVETGDTQLVVGVSPAGMFPLERRRGDERVEPADEDERAIDFARLLRRPAT